MQDRSDEYSEMGTASLQKREISGSKKQISGRSKDLTGQRFGMLTAIRPTVKRADHGSVVWECVCDCGKRKEVSANRLHRGKVRSCGCLSNPPVRDYIGERFGRLTVIEFLGRTNPANSMNYWKCRCDCGNETVVGQTDLQNGESTSCGCYQKQRCRETLKLIDGTYCLRRKARRDAPLEMCL